MTTTLTDINETLIEQNKTLGETSEGIKSLVSRISAQMEASEKSNLRGLEDKRETTKARVVERPRGFGQGFMQGTGLAGLSKGLSGLMGMVSGLIPGGTIGLIAGALGLAFGKLFKGALVGGIIAAYFGKGIMSWVRKTFDKDDNGKIFEDLPFELDLNDVATIGALTVATGVIANALIGFVAKNILAKAFGALLTGATGLILGGLGLGAGGAAAAAAAPGGTSAKPRRFTPRDIAGAKKLIESAKIAAQGAGAGKPSSILTAAEEAAARAKARVA